MDTSRAHIRTRVLRLPLLRNCRGITNQRPFFFSFTFKTMTRFDTWIAAPQHEKFRDYHASFLIFRQKNMQKIATQKTMR
ncbi:MAG TPA: hypothetical protein VE092_14730 [Herbaspirillum sp.]|uniref:hypothetical protein n=1 Tax=Herbaspirillum sp. TaxID=1890675 RepID=UPI002D6B217F|nr:hypothetical protein [Herbaspirillum sp.]HZG21264.1 hypothetical protein [Herbaspirillum sp.]